MEITKEDFPRKIIDDLLWAYGEITETELESKIRALNLSAENHIKASVLDFDALSIEELGILKAPFVAWQLYSKLELEEITKDKRADYYMLVESINEKQRENSYEKNNRDETRGIMVF